MSGAANCPETPRQKMIGMMYLVLTAMLALNVSADILNGFLLVDNSLISSINSSNNRREGLYLKMEDLYNQNPAKVHDWKLKADTLKQKSDEFIQFIHESKAALMQMSDGVEIGVDTVNKYKLVGKDNTDIASRYFIGADPINGTPEGQKFKALLEDYKGFVTAACDSSMIPAYEGRFSTVPAWDSHGTELKPWLNATFESMPIVAVTTQLSKYENDILATEQEMLNYFMGQTDAGDFRVNKIEAFVIPNSKNVMQGGQYRAQIVLAAVDSTKEPDYYIGSNKLSSGVYTVSCNSVGSFPFSGKIVLKGNDGIAREYPFKDEYSVSEPSATIANEDMNVVYKGFNNRLKISVPGVSDSKVKVDCSGGTLTKNGAFYICKPTGNTDIKISVSADVDGKIVPMGSNVFRVKALPDPTPFLRYTDDNGNVVDFNPNVDGAKKAPTRKQLYAAQFVAQYADGLLKANFRISSFALVANVRGGNTSKESKTSTFSEEQLSLLKLLKPGQEIFFKEIHCVGDKTTDLSFPPIQIPVK